MFNVVPRPTGATVVRLALVLEMPGAALIAVATVGRTPPLAALPAAALLLLGIVILSGGEEVEASVPAE